MMKRLVDVQGCNPMVHAHHNPVGMTNRWELIRLKVFVDIEETYFFLHTTE